MRNSNKQRARSDLLRFLLTDVGASQHGGLHSGENLQLCADGRNPLTHLQKDTQKLLQNVQGQTVIKCILTVKVKVGSHLFRVHFSAVVLHL